MPKLEELAKGPRSDLAKALGVKSYPVPPEHEAEWLKCKGDIVYWIETYVKTYDPRKPDGERWVSFILWPIQVAYMAWLNNQYKRQNHCVVCKCRTMGASWLTLCFFLHIWFFENDAKLTLGSYKEEKVDSPGNMDSLFEKARSVLKGLPHWMLPPGFDKRLHDLKLKLINPYNGSVMTGEAGDNCGTGGRSTAYLPDEFAKIDRSVQVQAAIQDNSNFIVYVSTPEGTANEFGRMVQDEAHPTFYFSVYDDPTRNHWHLVEGSWIVDKTPDGAIWSLTEGSRIVRSGNGLDGAPVGAVYPYLEEQRVLRDPVNFAQEVLGDVYASQKEQMFRPEWVRAAMSFKCKGTGQVTAGLDIGGGARLSTILTPRRGPKVLGQYLTGGESSAKKVEDLMSEVELARTDDGLRITQVTYDASGNTGADFAKALAGKVFEFTLIPFLGQSAPSKTKRWPDGRTSAERFATLRTEIGFLLQERFKKTYEKVNGIYNHPEEECISIPNDEELFRQLMGYSDDPTDTGKSRMMSKLKMRAAGIKFCDKADSLLYAFANEPITTVRYNRNKHNG